jgi:hypothetical protein
MRYFTDQQKRDYLIKWANEIREGRHDKALTTYAKDLRAQDSEMPNESTPNKWYNDPALWKNHAAALGLVNKAMEQSAIASMRRRAWSNAAQRTTNRPPAQRKINSKVNLPLVEEYIDPRGHQTPMVSANPYQAQQQSPQPVQSGRTWPPPSEEAEWERQSEKYANPSVQASSPGLQPQVQRYTQQLPQPGYGPPPGYGTLSPSNSHSTSQVANMRISYTTTNTMNSSAYSTPAGCNDYALQKNNSSRGQPPGGRY